MTKRQVPEIHPGEILRKEFMLPMGIAAEELAASMNISSESFHSILHGEMPLTADIAQCLGKFFNVDASFWINLQIEYDNRSKVDSLKGMLRKPSVPVTVEAMNKAIAKCPGYSLEELLAQFVPERHGGEIWPDVSPVGRDWLNNEPKSGNVPRDLIGSVVRYDAPTDPIEQDAWEACKDDISRCYEYKNDDIRTHQELDKRSLAMHRLVVEKLRRDPALFDKPKATLARWRTIVCPASQPYLQEWERLIEQGMETCLAVSVENSEHATALRQCSPFTGILTEQERLTFLNEWQKKRREP